MPISDPPPPVGGNNPGPGGLPHRNPTQPTPAVEWPTRKELLRRREVLAGELKKIDEQLAEMP